MHKDNDYIRDLLLECKESVDNQINVQEAEGVKRQHLLFLFDEGLLAKVNFFAFRLTSKGDAFTEVIRDDSTWQGTKAKAGKNASLKSLIRIALEPQDKRVDEIMGNKEMYNLIVLDRDWKDGSRESIYSRRFLEPPYTSRELIGMFPVDTQADLDEIGRFPCLFMNEGTENQLAHAGEITRISHSDGDMIDFEYVLYNGIEPVPNHSILKKMNSFGIRDEFEFQRNHWALKEGNLFRTLLSLHPVRKGPQVFQIDRYPDIDRRSVAVMMPFKTELDPVFNSIRGTAEENGLEAKRVKDIWEKDAIIQDIVNLIDRSSIVVCDCTGKNPNVFYELGIAHTLGKNVVMITQDNGPFPFDLGHLHHIKYHNNGEGLEKLGEQLQERFGSLKSQQ
ncbi:MAG: hypothetical protein OXC82_13145 [Rhodobacteraceae bacterium]|nr:hypothetical protein [Paracoccaceae bacterium]